MLSFTQVYCVLLLFSKYSSCTCWNLLVFLIPSLNMKASSKNIRWENSRFTVSHLFLPSQIPLYCIVISFFLKHISCNSLYRYLNSVCLFPYLQNTFCISFRWWSWNILRYKHDIILNLLHSLNKTIKLGMDCDGNCEVYSLFNRKVSVSGGVCHTSIFLAWKSSTCILIEREREKKKKRTTTRSLER